jgi:hypothetical protein
VGVTDAATADCFTKGLARPDTRRFLVFMMYGRDKVDLATAQAEVSFLGRCTDLAALFTQAALPRTVDSSTRQCFVTALHGADAALKNYWALKIAHADSDQVQQASDALGVAINQCRPGAQTGFTVPPN